MADSPAYSRASAFHGLDQGGNLDRREIAERVGDRIGQDDQVLMPHRATGVDDIGNIAFPFRGLRSDEGLARAREDFLRVRLVEENRADRIFSDRPDAMSQKQPALVEFDG